MFINFKFVCNLMLVIAVVFTKSLEKKEKRKNLVKVKYYKLGQQWFLNKCGFLIM